MSYYNMAVVKYELERMYGLLVSEDVIYDLMEAKPHFTTDQLTIAISGYWKEGL